MVQILDAATQIVESVMRCVDDHARMGSRLDDLHLENIMSLDNLKIASIFVCILLIVGYINRRKRKIHIPLMVSAFVIDMIIVLIIELTRGAIDAAKAKMGTLMIVHICISVTVIFLYFGQIYSGIKKAKGKTCGWHGKTGLLLLVTRIGNLITSFMVMQINS